MIVQTINSSTIYQTSRVDAGYHLSPGQLAASRMSRLREAGVEFLKLEGEGSVARVWAPGRFKRSYAASAERKVPYLRPYDVFSYLPEPADWLSEERTESLDTYRLKKGQILQTCSGRNLGPAVMVDKFLAKFVLSHDMIRIEIEDSATNYYVLAFLQSATGQQLLRRDMTGSVIDHLSVHQVAGQQIPILKDVFKQVSDTMARACELQEGARLSLSSLVDRLQSALPPTTGTTPRREGWTVRATSLARHGRIDAAYHDPLVGALQSQLLAMGGTRLGDVARVQLPGRFKRDYTVSETHGRPMVSGAQLQQAQPINLQFILPHSFRDVANYTLSAGWIAYTADGRAEEGLGTPVLITQDRNGWLASNHVGRIIPLTGIDPGWLWAALKTKQAQFQLKASASGSVVDATYPADVKEIILPPSSMVDGPSVVALWDQFRQARELELEAARLVETEIGRVTDPRVRIEPSAPSDTSHSSLTTDGVKRAKVDPRLLARLEQDEAMPTSAGRGISVILRVKSADNWAPPDGFQIQSVLGTIITGRASLDVVAALRDDPNVLRLEGERGGGVPECGTSVPFVGARTVHRRKPNEKGDHALIAVIDTGCDVLHKAFLDDAGLSRIVEIWDQRDLTGPTPMAVHGPGLADYGHIHTAADIAGYLAADAVPPALGRDVNGHGTHVASIAAGRQVGSFSGGVAPQAKLLIVKSKIEASAPDPNSIGYSQSHLHALAYIEAVATKLGLPVVVNVSQGMNAGAHDGTSLLEAGFDGFSGSGRKPGRVIVKSAGNERASNGHAKLTIAKLVADSLEWRSANVARPLDIIELWFKAFDTFKFQLINPYDEVSLQLTAKNSPVTGTFPSGNSYELSYERLHADNGDSRVCVIIRPAPDDIAPGKWRLDIEAHQVASSAVIHAWIEKVGRGPSLQFSKHQQEEMTLSIPGTAHSVITVGAVHSTVPLRTTDSSSYGPTRDERAKPDVVAPGQAIVAAKGGTKTSAVAMTGTSMAAPHVAGAIALLLSQRAKAAGLANVPNAQQIRAALRHNSRGFTGHPSPGTGYGLLDVQSFVDAFS